MDLTKIVYGILLGILGQTGSFFQLQVAYRYGWDKQYLWLILLSSIPTTWLYMKSVKFFIEGFDGLIYPSRLLGFGVGISVFVTLSWIMFKEPMGLKHIISIMLAVLIILVQIIFK